jgi:hypothetical protein
MFRSCFNTVESIARSVSVSLLFLGGVEGTSAEIVPCSQRTVLADGLTCGGHPQASIRPLLGAPRSFPCSFRDPVALVVSLGTSSQQLDNGGIRRCRVVGAKLEIGQIPWRCGAVACIASRF